MNLLISIFIGAIVSVMILFNGTLLNISGNFASSIIIHTVGLFSIVLLILLKKSKFKLQRKIPLYLYSAGAVGVFTVVFTNISFTELGVSITLAVGMLGQSIISILIDHFGWLGMKVIKFNRKKIIGLLIISLGIFIMMFY